MRSVDQLEFLNALAVMLAGHAERLRSRDETPPSSVNTQLSQVVYGFLQWLPLHEQVH